MSRLHQDELRTVALAEKVQVWQCVSARQLSLDQEFAGREARLFTGVIGYQDCIVYTNSSKPACLVLLLDSLLRTFSVLPTAVFVLVVSSKLRAGSATLRHVTGSHDLGSGFGEGSPVAGPVCDTGVNCTRVGARLSSDAQVGMVTLISSSCALLSFSGR